VVSLHGNISTTVRGDTRLLWLWLHISSDSSHLVTFAVHDQGGEQAAELDEPVCQGINGMGISSWTSQRKLGIDRRLGIVQRWARSGSRLRKGVLELLGAEVPDTNKDLIGILRGRSPIGLQACSATLLLAARFPAIDLLVVRSPTISVVDHELVTTTSTPGRTLLHG